MGPLGQTRKATASPPQARRASQNQRLFLARPTIAEVNPIARSLLGSSPGYVVSVQSQHGQLFVRIGKSAPAIRCAERTGLTLARGATEVQPFASASRSRKPLTEADPAKQYRHHSIKPDGSNGQESAVSEWLPIIYRPPNNMIDQLAALGWTE